MTYIFYNADTGKIVGAGNQRSLTWGQPTECIEVSQVTVPLERARVNLETLEIEPIPE